MRELSELLFGGIQLTSEMLEEKYKPRGLKEGAAVTRFAPSPTGFLHIGGLFAAMIAQKVARLSGGVFFLRIEDTDKKREVSDGIKLITDGLKAFDIEIDEGFVSADEEKGDYAPYKQSARAGIYQVYAKYLVDEGLAYPCFCGEEELAVLRETQEAKKQRTGYFGQYATCRNLSIDEIKEKLNAGKPFVIRLKSTGSEENRIKFTDLVKGVIEMPENDQDIVLLKRDGIPTYHFAHAVDDHLMRTTHVIRGDEWISSVPVHLQLFKALGFKPPKYAHIAPIMKEEGGGKRKLSKRKDPEAALSFYHGEGYPSACVTEYLMTLASSEYEDWRRQNPEKPSAVFPFKLKNMSVSGALFDLAKLNDVSKNTISLMTAEEVLKSVLSWSKEFDPQLYEIIHHDQVYAKNILNIDREGPKPRKDIAKWSDVKQYMAYFYDDLWKDARKLPENMTAEDAVAVLKEYVKIYGQNDQKDEWFAKIKSICAPLGFAGEVKEYKKNPENYKGHVGDVSTVIRIAVTGRINTPDLHAILRILGDKAVKRMESFISELGEEQ